MAKIFCSFCGAADSNMAFDPIQPEAQCLSCGKVTKLQDGPSQTAAPRAQGGDAFPMVGQKDSMCRPGMTLREWYAGQALAGEMATWQTTSPEGREYSIAQRCFAIADAMIDVGGQ